MIRKIKLILNNWVATNSYLREWYCSLKRKKGGDFFTEVYRRKHLNIIDNIELSIPLKPYPIFFIQDCNYYGLLFQLYKYANVNWNSESSFKHYIYIEHGIITGDFVNMYQINRAKIILTFSQFRTQKIKHKVQKPIYEIGPYLHYVDSLLSPEQIKAEKAELGKVLLVFPSHSIGIAEAVFDIDKFCDYIDQNKDGFDTVLVCLYWVDMQRGDYTKYQERGYRFCTAGHRDDLYFLSRLKSILLLSDMVVTNSIGTHMGYAGYLGLPINVYQQEISRNLKEGYEINKILFDEKSEIKKSYEKANNRIKQEFLKWETVLTAIQIEILEEVFGYKMVKAPEYLKGILKP